MAKRKRTKLIIPAVKLIESGKAKMAQVEWDGSLLFSSPFRDKTLKNPDGKKVITDKGCLSSFIIDAKSGQGHALAHVNLSELKKLVSKAEKMKKYWAKVNKERKKKKSGLIESSLIHLNTELTFFVNYKK